MFSAHLGLQININFFRQKDSSLDVQCNKTKANLFSNGICCADFMSRMHSLPLLLEQQHNFLMFCTLRNFPRQGTISTSFMFFES